jgi:uncharacterized protein (DUF4415 family)
MTAKKKPSKAWSDPDDAPDLTESPWREMMDAAIVRRGRPSLVSPKISTTIRLDADVLEAFKAGGPGWQSRINEALRKAAPRGGPARRLPQKAASKVRKPSALKK